MCVQMCVCLCVSMCARVMRCCDSMTDCEQAITPEEIRPDEQGAASGGPYNAVLMNWYEPRHTIGSHADDESNLEADLPIFSYSAGGTRRFCFHPKAGGALVLDLLLESGDLLVMGGAMQQTHKHSVPQIRKKLDTFVPRNRINFTVRAFKRADSSSHSLVGGKKARLGDSSSGFLRKGDEP